MLTSFLVNPYTLPLSIAKKNKNILFVHYSSKFCFGIYTLVKFLPPMFVIE